MMVSLFSYIDSDPRQVADITSRLWNTVACASHFIRCVAMAMLILYKALGMVFQYVLDFGI